MSILKANRIENLTTTDGGINVNNSGNVGVGTSSPGQALDVVGSSGSNTPITWLRSTGNRGYLHSDGGGVGIGSSSTLNDAGIYLVTNTQIGFRVNGSERMRIDSSGRVLMGLSSTSSTTLLQVEGKSNSGTAHGGILLRRGSAPGTNDALGYVLFGANDSNAPIEIGGFRDGGTWSSGSSMPTRLVFSTTADGASSATERMRIDSSGNLRTPEKQDVVFGVDVNTSSGDGGDLTVKSGNGSGSGNDSGNLYLAAGRGSSGDSQAVLPG